MKERFYSTSRFARRAAVSVRTLRFYDQAGLLTPARRSESGYRQYSEADLPRLQQILALKFLGFSLEEIKRFLAAGPRRLQESLVQQKQMLREKRAQLDAILRAIEQAERHLEADESSFESVAKVIEVIQMQQKNEWVNKYFTPEQQQTMEQLSKSAYSEEARAKLAARGPWTEEDQQRADQQWGAVNSGLKQLVETGADPTGPEAQAWAKGFDDLVSAFTQSDPEIEAGLKDWWKQHGELPEAQQPMGPLYSAEERSFMDKALAAYREGRER